VRTELVDVGEVWKHTTGRRMRILARVQTEGYGATWIAEDLNTFDLIPIGGTESHMVNWSKE
jgi:hypothetical protein